MRQETINIYTFDELSKEAQEQAIQDHIQFEIEDAFASEEKRGHESFVWDAIEEAKRLQTPWFTAQIIYEKYKDLIIETIKANGYEFTADGKMY